MCSCEILLINNSPLFGLRVWYVSVFNGKFLVLVIVAFKILNYINLKKEDNHF